MGHDPLSGQAPETFSGLEIIWSLCYSLFKMAKRNYVGFWIRLVALVIDLVVLSVLQRLIIFAFRPPLRGLFSLVLSLGYAPFMIYQYQATLGKMALGIKVSSQDGKKMELFQVLLREWVGKFLSAIVFFLGFIWVAFDEKKQAWHDKLARTIVVKA
jgi:uncharacterized RDD family membrane protein YckC